MNRYLFFAMIVISVMSIHLSCQNEPANKHLLVKKWETDAVFKLPESVLLDKANNSLYISNMEGPDTWAADGKGAISKMDTDGKNINVEWVTGLNAPRGLGLYNGKLYVADIKNVVVIDINSARIEKKIPVTGSIGLNDISIDKEGVVYVSDSEGKKIYKIRHDTVSLFLDNLKQPNGMLVHMNNLYVLESGGLYKVDSNKKMTLICEGLKGPDGVESINDKDFIVSGWDGLLYYVYPDGKKEKLLDTIDEDINAADIGLDKINRIVFVPTCRKNSVAAYEIK